jgi:hypothetical protein
MTQKNPRFTEPISPKFVARGLKPEGRECLTMIWEIRSAKQLVKLFWTKLNSTLFLWVVVGKIKGRSEWSLGNSLMGLFLRAKQCQDSCFRSEGERIRKQNVSMAWTRTFMGHPWGAFMLYFFLSLLWLTYDSPGTDESLFRALLSPQSTIYFC